MWLPKDERYLLIAYYTCMPELRIEGEIFSVDELRYFVTKNSKIPFVVLRKVTRLARELSDKRKTNSEPSENQQQYHEFLKAKQTIEAANRMLDERGFLKVREHGTGLYEIKMKLEGLDLGRKYSSISGTAWAWCNEYKVWFIIGLIISFVSVLIAILKDRKT